MTARSIQRLLTLVCSVLAASSLRGQVPQAVPGIDDVLRPVRMQFAPDRRLSVFDITAELTPQGVIVKGEVERADARDAVLQALRAAGHGPLIDQVAVLPDPALGSATTGLVRVSVANVKSKPSHPAEMATQAVMGWAVSVLKKQSGWYYVHTEPDRYLGWIEELQLTLVTSEAARAWAAAPRVVVTTPVAYVRERAVADAIPVTEVVMGSRVKRLDEQAGWLNVELPDGRTGFMRADEAADHERWQASTRPTPENVEGTAQLFMGVPYLWGGTSSKGFDCSGFAKTVLRMNGIELTRDTDQQAQEGSPVPIDETLSQFRKGDLLFFGARATADRPERISHVGIFVGNGEFLHASGLVRRNSLLASSPIYSESLRQRLLRVRRVVPQ
jgi:cell wall-associated NlpC family hydrolase